MPTTTAPPATSPALTRNLRRSKPAGAGGAGPGRAHGGGDLGPGLELALRRRDGSGSDPTTVPTGEDGTAAGAGLVRWRRNHRTATPARVPRIDGQASTGLAPGRVSAAHTPMTPKATVPAMPIQRRRTEATPSTIEMTDEGDGRAGDQGVLVVLAEGLDGELLQPVRRVRHDHLADRHDRRAGALEDAGDQLADGRAWRPPRAARPARPTTRGHGAGTPARQGRRRACRAGRSRLSSEAAGPCG